jgi:hypothetical protein
MSGEGYSALNILIEGLKRVAVVFELLKFTVMAVWDIIKNSSAPSRLTCRLSRALARS